MDNKIKNKDRFIAKMISTGLITAGILGAGVGIGLCRHAVVNNPDNYNEKPLYTAGVITTVLSVPVAQMGVVASSDNKNEEDENSLQK